MRYLHYDVFTDRLFEGNQLAVFSDGRGQIARVQVGGQAVRVGEGTIEL